MLSSKREHRSSPENRAENERLRAQVAYLGELRPLREQERRRRSAPSFSLKGQHRLDARGFRALARSTFFYHQARLRNPDPHADLKAAITAVFEGNRGRYGIVAFIGCWSTPDIRSRRRPLDGLIPVQYWAQAIEA